MKGKKRNQDRGLTGQNIPNFLRKNYFLLKCFVRIFFPSYSLFEKIEVSHTADKGSLLC